MPQPQNEPQVVECINKRRVPAGTRVVYWDVAADTYACGTVHADTNMYPLHEQAAPAPFYFPSFFICARDRHTFTVGRVYTSKDTPTLLYAPSAELAPTQRGRVAPLTCTDTVFAGERKHEQTAPVANPTAPITTAPAQQQQPTAPIMPTTQQQTAAPSADTAAALAALLATLTPTQTAPEIPADLLERLTAVETAIANVSAPLRIEITRAETPNVEPVDIGVQHCEFPVLLATVQARLPNGRRVAPWLVGPAGTGKTKAGAGLAHALNLPFVLVGTLTDAFQVLGYCDAKGDYVRTPFRDAWEHGGVILLDEADRADAHATVALLGGLDSGVMQFPDARVSQHADCIVMAGANTTGTGATAQFRAAKAQDSAFADRFVFLDWPHDDALESSLSTNAVWLRYVRAVRQEVRARKLPEQGFDVTTRATLDGEALLAQGLSVAHVVHMAVRRRIPAPVWAEITAACPVPAALANNGSTK